VQLSQPFSYFPTFVLSPFSAEYFDVELYTKKCRISTYKAILGASNFGHGNLPCTAQESPVLPGICWRRRNIPLNSKPLERIVWSVLSTSSFLEMHLQDR
jgi:hypothetical protein